MVKRAVRQDVVLLLSPRRDWMGVIGGQECVLDEWELPAREFGMVIHYVVRTVRIRQGVVGQPDSQQTSKAD